MTEYQETIVLANRILDRPGEDPDSDEAMLARQFLRSTERETMLLDALKFAIGEVPERIETVAGISCRFCNSSIVRDHAAVIRHAKHCPWRRAKDLVANLETFREQ